MNRRTFRVSAALVAGLLVTGGLDASLTSSSTAATQDPLRIVGTSDVSDSCLLAPATGSTCTSVNLHDKILAATGVNVSYTGSATSVAINSAKQGVADLLIVHAASLENQFVAPPSGPSYSLESAGRSLMWGDFVLAGYTGDPAGVVANGGQHDIVAAYHRIALQGLAGHAHFVSRTGGPGTTVQEHAIWQLVDQTYNHDIPMCTVSDANGGGMSPGVADTSATDGTCGTSPTYPSWYSPGNRKQAENVRFADVCSIGGSTYTNCYVFTDRGTLLNLQSENPPEATHLTTVTRNNATTAPGGFEALVNAFHIYAINPAAVPSNSNIDTADAVKVMNYLTSPAGQAVIGGYLPADPPFLPAASPKLTLSRSVPSSVVGSKQLTVSGSLANKIPGYPKLAGMRVNLLGTRLSGSATPVTVASALTNADGAFTLHYTPSASQRYTLSVPGAKRLEKADLSPQFFDLLTGSSTNLGLTSVNASFTKVTKGHKRKTLHVSGPLTPAVTGNGARLVLYRAKVGHKLRPSVSRHLNAGARRFDQKFKFKKGRWKYELVYENPGVITPVATKVFRVRIH